MTQPISLSRVRSSLASVVRLPSDAPTFAALMAVLVISIACLVVISAVFDARLARDALDLPPWVVDIATAVSAFGRSGYMFALSGLLALGSLLARQRLPDRRFDAALTALSERATYIFAVLAVSGILAQLIKHLVGRARPKLMQSFGPYHFDILSMKNSLASFPSGHSTTAFAMATALGFILPRWRVPLYIAAVLIAVSRIMVQAHYASDIVAGAALGTISALAVTRYVAGLAFAFEPVDGSIRLKGRGVIAAAMAGRTRAP
jgi:membrane-associated phospholipid phosphatase